MSRIIRSYIVDIVETDDVIYCDNDGHLTYNIEADKNELVRCSDCDYRGDPIACPIEGNDLHHISDFDFCSWGELKDGDTK